MEDGVTDERFPDAIGKYAAAMPARFKGMVNHYSPHNEPQVTCLFCGLTGRWPPYLKGPANWAKVGVQVAKGMVLEMEAIRGAISDAVIVSIDPFLYAVTDGFLPPRAKMDDRSMMSFDVLRLHNLPRSPMGR
jgi:beta-glucosidase